MKAAKFTVVTGGLPDAPSGAIRLGVDLHRVVDQASAVIACDADVFQRDGALVHVVRTADNEADASTLAGTPQIRPLQPATVLEKLTEHSEWEKFDKRNREWVPSMPTGSVVAALIARGQWRDARPIVGVIEAPSMRPDGSILQEPGYDGATGFLYVPSEKFQSVEPKPSKDAAVSALAELEEVFCDFPHENPAHRSVAVAALLTIIARPAIVGATPAIINDASTRGTGKTLQADAISIVATGRASAKMGYPADDVELEKVLGAYALRGALLINFDNVTRAFGGGPLDRCLTATDIVELRVLGKSEVPRMPWRAVVLATGNNVEIVGDTSRRSLVSRQVSPLENPEDRSGFPHPELLAWVRAERPRLVRAALTLLRAFVVAGRPAQCKPWGSFEEWTRLVADSLVWAGAANPLDARPSADSGADPEKAALLGLLEGWPRLDPGNGLTAKGAIEALYSAERLKGQAAPDGFDDLREAIETVVPTMPGKPPSPIKLSGFLKHARDRVVGGRFFSGKIDRTGIVRWCVTGAGVAGVEGDVSNPRGQKWQ